MPGAHNLKLHRSMSNLKTAIRPIVLATGTARGENIWLSGELFESKIYRSQIVMSPLIGSIQKRALDPIDQTNRSGRLIDEWNILCPVSLHQKLALSRFDTECKCKKFSVPVISDVEYDYLIRLLPVNQLVVVVIIDSFNAPMNIQNIAEGLYTATNKNRIQPCKESMRDEVRYFFYDTKTAVQDSDHTIPLLVTRHNIMPGMALIYKGAKLLFCDHIFNGYGYSEKDFAKQLIRSKEDYMLGKFLPYNFRFKYYILY